MTPMDTRSIIHKLWTLHGCITQIEVIVGNDAFINSQLSTIADCIQSMFEYIYPEDDVDA